VNERCRRFAYALASRLCSTPMPSAHGTLPLCEILPHQRTTAHASSEHTTVKQHSRHTHLKHAHTSHTLQHQEPGGHRSKQPHGQRESITPQRHLE
jgi:hypothetical protein